MGVTQDPVEAVRLYKLAADQDESLAQLNLGGVQFCTLGAVDGNNSHCCDFSRNVL
jgi:hypothetical protein